MKSRAKALVAYVPAPHRGYLELFRKHEAGTLLLLGEDFIADFKSLVRHLPACDSAEVDAMVRGLHIFQGGVHILTKDVLEEVKAVYKNIVMPNEDVSHVIAERYFQDSAVEFDGSWRLRWDWGATQAKRRPEGESVVSFNEFDRSLMHSAFATAERSPDWWRQIGALLVDVCGNVLCAAFNRHVPSEQSAYLEGDPRSNFEQGQRIEVSCALHAEAGIVAEAAYRGLSMRGCDLYVTTFPCPPCAYLCAFSGIKRLFYVDGYALIAGAEALQARGVGIVRVSM